MNREFLDLYNRELGLLYEQARDFAEEHPGIADRLGGLVRDRMDPMVDGLLQGTAFMAARVQLKIKHEFPEFTQNLLDQLLPNYLAPSPSAALVRVEPPWGDPGLRDGRTLPRGAALDSVYSPKGSRVACRFRLTAPIELWPFHVTAAAYLSQPGQLRALGIPAGPTALAALRLTLTVRTTALGGEEEASAEPASWFKGCRAERLRFHFVGPEAEAATLCEQVFAHRTGAWVRHLDRFGNPVVTELGRDDLAPVGFDEDESLIPNDTRVFGGFDLLRDLSLLPAKFCGMDLLRFDAVTAGLPCRTADLVLAFDQVDARLAALDARAVALYAAPAVNLFEVDCDRVPIRTREHEHQVVPDRSNPTAFEPHRVLGVHAHVRGVRDRMPALPLYAAQMGEGGGNGLYFTLRRTPRQRTAAERAYGSVSDYAGTDMFLSLVEPAGIDDASSVAELSVRALCSNRHLAELLPTGSAPSDFRFVDDTSLRVVCVQGPTRPRQPVVAQLRGRGEVASTGAVAWRLVNMLALNHLGLVERGAGHDGVALREILSLFADLSDHAQARRVRGVRGVDARPVNRRVRRGSGVGVARGTEVSVLVDEAAFEGSNPFLLGAVLDRFFAEYAGFNHFTETVIRSTSRSGELARWPVRTGLRRPL